MIEEAWIVFDLGFGDAGKGATVDFLVRRRRAGLVVRYNGGAQAGHNVVTPGGRHHTFSQFGAGSFVSGARTLLGPDFVLHPGGLLEEEEHLRRIGVPDVLERTWVDRRALVVTPFQQAAGRLRELLRGERAHGSCGLGIGEAVGDALAGHGDEIRVADLGDLSVVKQKLAAQRERKGRELAEAGRLAERRGQLEWGLLENAAAVGDTIAQWEPLARRLRRCSADETARRIRETRVVVFEGAQGMLLDQDHGFHPHTTWSDCTPAGALALLSGSSARVSRLAVSRPYMIRHGRGPLPTADARLDAALPEAHNDDEGWQGSVRRGALDLVLLRWALRAAGGADGLALTCLDRFRERLPVATAYRREELTQGGREPDRGPLRELEPPDPSDLTARWELTRRLDRVTPRRETVAVGELPALLGDELGLPLWIESRGPTWRDRRAALP